MLIRRSRNIIGAAKVLGEGLGTFELGCDFAWAERFDAGGLEIIDHARDQRRFRADHDEADMVLLAERDQRCVIGDVKGNAFGFARDTSVAGCAEQAIGERTSRHLPRERVLAPAGPEEKYVHDGLVSRSEVRKPWSTLRCELQDRRDTSKVNILVGSGFEHSLCDPGVRLVANVKSTPRADSGFLGGRWCSMGQRDRKRF